MFLHYGRNKMSSNWWVFVVTFSFAKLTASEIKQPQAKNPYFTKFQNTAHLRPSKCQVCRLLVTEFQEKMKMTNNKKELHTGYSTDLSGDKKIDYHTSELRFMEVVDGLCDRMRLYQARAGPQFPYIKGAMGHLREVFSDMKKRSKVKLNFELPDDIIDDFTHEITRVKFECINMLEKVEDYLEDWYFNHQNQDLLKWLCVDKVLDRDKQDCLAASTDMPKDYYAAYDGKEAKTIKDYTNTL